MSVKDDFLVRFNFGHTDTSMFRQINSGVWNQVARILSWSWSMTRNQINEPLLSQGTDQTVLVDIESPMPLGLLLLGKLDVPWRM
jgi:hypothetical protein